ncbi:MAG TPA: hypothetical protein VK629_18915, partial [Steroidobacteraceae bacterium]|nr:hypothetical protein [Steroidobacteraceae bacterium]
PNRAFQDDAARWARELRVMTMPYFGLPAKLANNLWKAVDKCGLATQAIKVQQEQAVIVRNAIIAKSVVTQRVDGVDRDLSKRELDEQVYEFLRQRMERVEPKQWRIPIQKGRKST